MGAMRSTTCRAAWVLTLLGALSARPAMAACDGGEAELTEAIGAALGAWSSANRAVYTRARAQVEACVEGTRDVLAPETVAAWFRFQAVDVLFQKRDVAGARLMLAASHAVDPDFSWEGSVLVSNPDLPPMIEEAFALPAGDPAPVAQDRTLRTYINGRPAVERPALVPVLLQVESPAVGVLITRVLGPGEDWTPEDVPGYDLAQAAWVRRQRSAKLAFKAGGGLLVGAGLVSGGAIVGSHLIRDGSEDPDVVLDGIMLGVGGQIGAAVLAGAGLTSLGLGVRMRW